MNDILFGNNNKAIIKKITRRELSADKKRNFFIVVAILLTAFMLTSVFSIGMSYYDTIAMREKRMQGSFGMLKTVGTTPKQIRRIVTGQVLRLSMIGLPLGCLIAAAVSLLIVPAIISNSGIETGAVVSFSPAIYIGAILFSLLTAWLGAITPARKAANSSPIEALHYTGEQSSKAAAHRPVKGKPLRMAVRNVFRDRKRAAIVMLSLFLSITVFTSVMTVVNGINIDNYINSEYDYDFFFTADMNSTYFLDEGFAQQVQKNNGIKDTSATRISSVELKASESLTAYAERLAETLGLSADTVVTDGVFYNTHTLKGVDPVLFDTLNETLPVPIDRESFERGEVAIINAAASDLSGYFDGVSTLEIKRETDTEYLPLAVGGIVCLPLFL